MEKIERIKITQRFIKKELTKWKVFERVKGILRKKKNRIVDWA